MSTTETRQLLPVGTWNVDPVHSQVGFAVEYVVGTFRGSFAPVDASLSVADDGTATLTGKAPVSGVKVQDPNLEAHLQSPDFFDAERAPEITFTSTDVRRSGSEIEIDGELAIRGTSQPVDADRHRRRARGRPVRRHALQPQARDHDRPDAVRDRLEQPAPERRALARERRHADRRALLVKA